MKLIYCPICGDVQRLIDIEWRTCVCQESGGQYNRDLMTATVLTVEAQQKLRDK